MQKEQEVILVNEHDEQHGIAPKMHAHENGLLHRAFSIFIFNTSGEMLLQQRALDKYHGGGLWTNACCSHPRPGELLTDAVTRRLEEEMGFTARLEKIFDFVYRADVENGLVEHEFDHVFAGVYDGPVMFNSDEVMDSRYVPMDEIAETLKIAPAQYTTWFRLIFERIYEWHKMQNFD